MNITKAFTSQQQVKQFQYDYSTGAVDSEVITNLVSHPQARELRDFLCKDHNSRLMLVVSSIAHQALAETFGKHDFTFEGNRFYSNWVLRFMDELFVVPDKREVIHSGELSEKQIASAIDFEIEFINFCLEYAINHCEKINTFVRVTLDNLVSEGVVVNARMNMPASPIKKNKL